MDWYVLQAFSGYENKLKLTLDDNLFIVDASIFPTSSSVNPAATIQALSLHKSSNIWHKYKNLFTK